MARTPDHDKRALGAHHAPPWFDDAKLGIFIHWGLYSVPGWAAKPSGEGPAFAQIAEGLTRGANPYAEWYWNSLRTPGSVTARHHRETYGDAGYEDFRAPFNEMVESWDPDEWAELFAAAGAGYVVLTTKHHDGFLLWPSDHRNPHRPGWQTERDVVGELAAAVRRRGMRFGVYYSGGLDWTFVERSIDDLASVYGTVPTEPAYGRYVDAHFRELVDRYEPSVLWNDIGMPPNHPLDRLLVDYLDRVPDGAINDRWRSPTSLVVNGLNTRLGSAVANAIGRRIVSSGATPQKVPYFADFATPEYATEPEVRGHKWESCRGLGHSFGYNRAEGEDDHLDPTELIRGFVDGVAKNGNLLLNVGPRGEDGVIPGLQADRLRALGTWLDRCGEAIRGTRPWVRAEGRTADGTEVRFTQKDGDLYAVVLGDPMPGSLRIPDVGVRGAVELLGHGPLEGAADGSIVAVEWPSGIEAAPAHALRISRR